MIDNTFRVAFRAQDNDGQTDKTSREADDLAIALALTALTHNGPKCGPELLADAIIAAFTMDPALKEEDVYAEATDLMARRIKYDRGLRVARATAPIEPLS